MNFQKWFKFESFPIEYGFILEHCSMFRSQWNSKNCLIPQCHFQFTSNGNFLPKSHEKIWKKKVAIHLSILFHFQPYKFHSKLFSVCTYFLFHDKISQLDFVISSFLILRREITTKYDTFVYHYHMPPFSSALSIAIYKTSTPLVRAKFTQTRELLQFNKLDRTPLFYLENE